MSRSQVTRDEPNFLPRSALHGLLVRRGHTLERDRAWNTDVTPPPEAVVTVAMNLLPFIALAYRERYFVTLLDEEDDTPLIRHHPDFALPASFAAAVDKEPIGGREMRGNFLLGPFRWLIRRLVRFPRLLVWPEDQIRVPDGFVRDRWVLDEMPRLKGWLQVAGPVPPDAGAIVLDPGNVRDCQVLWEIADQVEASFYNYFVSDIEAIEVYNITHHSLIFISIISRPDREDLIKELAKCQWVIEDCSASVLDWGDDMSPDAYEDGEDDA